MAPPDRTAHLRALVEQRLMLEELCQLGDIEQAQPTLEITRALLQNRIAVWPEGQDLETKAAVARLTDELVAQRERLVAALDEIRLRLNDALTNLEPSW